MAICNSFEKLPERERERDSLSLDYSHDTVQIPDAKKKNKDPLYKRSLELSRSNQARMHMQYSNSSEQSKGQQ